MMITAGNTLPGNSMSVIRIQGVTHQFGAQVVLDDVSLELQEGEIAGLVGANGAGKTTLFRLIVGELTPEHGTITLARGLRIGYLQQEPELAGERTLIEEVSGVFAEVFALEKKLHDLGEQIAAAHEGPGLSELLETYERVNSRFLTAGGQEVETRIRECLGGLGFAPADYRLRVAVLSGGQKCRAALSKLLLQDRQFLLLDEPTNHLDIDAVRWLEKFLAGHHGGAVIISHDRYLLDRLCTRIIELEHHRVHSYPGNYSNFAQTKHRQILTLERRVEKDSAFIAKEREFIARHLAGQRSREAQGRRTRLERQLAAGELVTGGPRGQRSAKLAFRNVEGRAGTVVRCEDLGVAYGERVLFRGLSFQVQAGDRLGITGPNGAGKTTLLRVLLGQVTPTEGTAVLDTRRGVGYYAQEPAELDPARSILDEIHAGRPDLSEPSVRSILGAFRFSGDEVFKPLGLLSGGEQSRVRLAGLILAEPEVLVLDEPTNHLDIASREVVEESLQGFGGTIIAVSHDRYFLDRIVRRLLVLRPDGHAVYGGNYSFYLAEVEQEASESDWPSSSAPGEPAPVPSPNRLSSESSQYDRLSIEEIEKLIIEREGQLAALQERFGDSTLYRNAESLASIMTRMSELNEELRHLNAAWDSRIACQ